MCLDSDSVHANIIGTDKVLGPICISIQKEPSEDVVVPKEGTHFAQSRQQVLRRQILL